MIWGVFYILKKSVRAARRGMCSTLTYHSIFNLPIPTQIPTQNTQKSFENYFDAPSKSPLFPITFSSLKIPQSHRITLKSHSKITKSQVKSTHSRTKTNNPIPITKIHTIPPYRHTKNQHKNKAKTHIKVLTQYTKTSLL